MSPLLLLFFFFFNDTATTEIYTLSLHDALPIYPLGSTARVPWIPSGNRGTPAFMAIYAAPSLNSRIGPSVRPPSGNSKTRSEEHTSELQSPCNLVCRLLLEKKKKKRNRT